MVEELYALPFIILPCELVNGSDTRYLNHLHPSVHNPLKDVLDIVSYNDTYFLSPHLIASQKFDYNRDTLQCIHPSQLIPFPSIIELYDGSNTIPISSVIDLHPAIIVEPHTPRVLFVLLLDSKKLFFILYISIDSISLM